MSDEAHKLALGALLLAGALLLLGCPADERPAAAGDAGPVLVPVLDGRGGVVSRALLTDRLLVLHPPDLGADRVGGHAVISREASAVVVGVPAGGMPALRDAARRLTADLPPTASVHPLIAGAEPQDRPALLTSTVGLPAEEGPVPEAWRDLPSPEPPVAGLPPRRVARDPFAAIDAVAAAGVGGVLPARFQTLRPRDGR